MKQSWSIIVTCWLAAFSSTLHTDAIADDPWVVDSQEQWEQAKNKVEHLTLADGNAKPAADHSRFLSSVKKFQTKRRAGQVVFTQSPEWNNWRAVPNVGPADTSNAPVFLPVGDKDYWYFAAKKGSRGYHAWHSTDMKTWTHHGQVSKSHWVTTAEYADGKFYIYFDQPNDEDPHLIIDDDLTDGDLKNEMIGKVFADPSHGSDAGILRDDDGTFHLFYEDWDPINARKHSWDSPLGGHAESADGIHGFKPHEYPAPIDERTKATGKFAEYKHPAGTYKYQIHEPDQNAYGDYTLIKVGGQYYVFCDFDPVGRAMRVGCWTSDSIKKQFQWSSEIGSGFHPDPTVGFAEGKFYLLVQRNGEDFVSTGPWNEGVQARAGVDIDGDGNMDQWTDWQVVRETYTRKPGFARVIQKSPASIDLSKLPAGVGFQFEYKTEPVKDSKTRPVMDRVVLEFQQDK